MSIHEAERIARTWKAPENKKKLMTLEPDFPNHPSEIPSLSDVETAQLNPSKPSQVVSICGGC